MAVRSPPCQEGTHIAPEAAAWRRALAGVSASQTSLPSADGTGIERFPGPVYNQLEEIPDDLPARIAVDEEDRSMLVADRAIFTGNADHRAVLEDDVEDTGLGPGQPVVTS